MEHYTTLLTLVAGAGLLGLWARWVIRNHRYSPAKHRAERS